VGSTARSEGRQQIDVKQRLLAASGFPGHGRMYKFETKLVMWILRLKRDSAKICTHQMPLKARKVPVLGFGAETTCGALE
jgi:hypothetical protein